jgi:hypothetical protein
VSVSPIRVACAPRTGLVAAPLHFSPSGPSGPHPASSARPPPRAAAIITAPSPPPSPSELSRWPPAARHCTLPLLPLQHPAAVRGRVLSSRPSILLGRPRSLTHARARCPLSPLCQHFAHASPPRRSTPICLARGALCLRSPTPRRFEAMCAEDAAEDDYPGPSSAPASSMLWEKGGATERHGRR